jgi:transcriptional regulator with XRE-family HTH domain
MRKSKIGQGVIRTARGVGAVDLHVGGRIRALRNLKEMSQEQLGEALGVSFQQVQKYEKGMNRVSGGRLLQIAATLGCTASDLLENAPTNGKPVKHVVRDGSLSVAALDEVARDHVGIRMFKAYLGLTPNLRVAITQMAERLAATA